MCCVWSYSVNAGEAPLPNGVAGEGGGDSEEGQSEGDAEEHHNKDVSASASPLAAVLIPPLACLRLPRFRDARIDDVVRSFPGAP